MPLTTVEYEHAVSLGLLPDWNYMPGDDEDPIEGGKPSDFGWYEGRIVAVDYANTTSVKNAMFSSPKIRA